LDTVGESPRRVHRSLRRFTRRFGASLTVKFVTLIAILFALPVVLFIQFKNAYEQTEILLTAGIKSRNLLIAQALTPLLERTEGFTNSNLSDALEKINQDDVFLKLMFRPRLSPKTDLFFLMAAAPAVSTPHVGPAPDDAARPKIQDFLVDACNWGVPVEFRQQQPDGSGELLTSIVPIDVKSGCWVLLSTHSGLQLLKAGVAWPDWHKNGMQAAALVYGVFACLAVLLVVSVRRALRNFRYVAHDIRQSGAIKSTFASRNTIPELASVASDFDQLVFDLHRAAADIREAAQDNAHAFKSPIATIRSALAPLKKAVAKLDPRSQRAIQLIDSSLVRLAALVDTTQWLGDDAANLIEAPRRSVNLTLIVLNAAENAREIAMERGVNVTHQLATAAHVMAPEGVLNVVIENIIDNALSFSIPGQTISVTLSRNANRADLLVEDEGPGADQKRMGQIFDRHFSLRPSISAQKLRGEGRRTPSHAGLGLWIVRSHVEALGGAVTASNRPNGGFSIHIALPIDAAR